MNRQALFSVPNPNAQTTTLCQAGGSREDQFLTIYKSLADSKRINAIELTMVELLLRNGLRVSELLKIKGTDIISDCQFIVTPSKGSASRLGVFVDCSAFLLTKKGLPGLVFDCYDRFFVYRLFKKLGIYSALRQGKNESVTHSLRHNFIENVQAVTNNIEATAEIVGHKNVESTKIYTTKTLQKSTTKEAETKTNDQLKVIAQAFTAEGQYSGTINGIVIQRNGVIRLKRRK